MIHILIALYAFWDEKRRDLGNGFSIDPETNNITWNGTVNDKVTVLDLHKFLRDEMRK